MRISSVTLYRFCIPFRRSFVHAQYSRTETDTLILSLTSDDGMIGFGEVLPRSYLTGEDLDSAVGIIRALACRWAPHIFRCRDEVMTALDDELQRAGRKLATLAGWELACLDLAGKTFGFEAGDVLGPVVSPGLDSGAVIDFSIPLHALHRYCMLLRLRGHRHLKVKVGHDHQSDLRRLDIISNVFGGAFPLRIDANGIWTAKEAVAALRNMRRFNLHSIEQPVGAGDLHGMRTVREETGLPVMADESLCSLEDAERLIQARAADIFNIRIAKCGGFLASLRLVKLAKEAGLRCHLGTLVGETGILSHAAEIFGQRVGGFECLEGKWQNETLLLGDIVEIPKCRPAANHGLGLKWRPNSPAKWFISAYSVLN